MLRNYSAKLIKGGDPAKIRLDCVTHLGAIIGEARSRCSSSVSVGQVSVAPGLAWSLSYFNSVLNLRLFHNWMKWSPDPRMYMNLQIQSLNPYMFASKFYPRLYPLTLDIYDVEEGQPMPGDYIE